MHLYKKLLVGVDGSETSLHALQESFKLAREDILVVAVAPPYTGDLRPMGVSDIGKLLREPCETALAKANALAEAAGVQIRPVCVMAEPYEGIVELAEEEDRDLIVLGVRGSSFAHRLLVGTTTARVIGLSSQDVLAVPEKASLGWERLLLATDGSEYSSKAAHRAVELAQCFGGTLKVVSVLEISPHVYAVAPEVAEEKIKLPRQHVLEVKEQATAKGIITEDYVRESESASEVIVELAQEKKIDLIVMGSHGRTGLKRLLMGSVTERVMAQAPCPVLVVKLT